MSYTNDNLVQIILNLLRENRMNQAILLDAPWGSGKTHFVKNHLVTALEQASDESGSDYEQILYISLFGMSETEEITDAIYSSYIAQFVQNKAEEESGKRISKYINFTKLLTVGSKLALTFAKTKGLETDTLPSVEELFHPHSTIIIFDDLERCKIDLINVYGYINNLIEHSNIKVILVASQANLMNQDIKEQHEKLIGLTIKYQPNYVEIYKELVNSDYISTDSLKNLLLDTEITNWTIDTLIAFHHLNLRTLIYTLINFDMIYRQIEEVPHPEPDVWDRLLLEIYKYTLMCSIKMRLGDSLDAWKKEFTYPLSITFYAPQVPFSVIGFHFINTFLMDHYMDNAEYRETITHRLESLSRLKKSTEAKANQAYSKLTDDKYLDYTLKELLVLARQIPRDIAKDYYSFVQFQDIILLLLTFKNMYPDYQTDFEQIISDCQMQMIDYIQSHSDVTEPNYYIYLGDQIELEEEYDQIINPILDAVYQRENSLNQHNSSSITLWGDELYKSYKEKDVSDQKRFFQYLNLDWAIGQIKESSIKNLRLFTKTIHYYYITQNVPVTIDDCEVISRFLITLNPLAKDAEDINRKKAFAELIDLLHKLVEDDT